MRVWTEECKVLALSKWMLFLCLTSSNVGVDVKGTFAEVAGRAIRDEDPGEMGHSLGCLHDCNPSAISIVCVVLIVQYTHSSITSTSHTYVAAGYHVHPISLSCLSY